MSVQTQVLEALQWRYAVKKFDASRVIPDDVWQVLEQSLVLAPSSFGLQPWKFFVVRDLALKQQLLPHSWNQSQVVDASHVVVFAIKKNITAADADRLVARMAEVRNVPLESLQGYNNVMKGFLEHPPAPLDAWATKQVYIALSQFMVAAALLQVDTCPMEGFIPMKYDEILGLPELGYSSVVVCPAGYRSPEDKYATVAKVRFATEELVQYI
ncbi:MAG: NAD(P)H-dependent oxidoreductase [Oscillatoriales cyanobacterium SM2_2_1]|nr:NAD(P)H-dependent oxidoreductase [Oscillatoriales cyanobacterium SM2_2_1]